MELHKLFAETVDAFGIKGKDLATQFGCTPGYISEFRRGVCGMPVEKFGELLEVAEELAPGFKKDFARRISQFDLKVNQLSLEDIVLGIDSGRLSNDEIAKIYAQVADILIAVSKRLKLE